MPRTTRIEDKYKSPPCLAYRLILKAKAERSAEPAAEAAITEAPAEQSRPTLVPHLLLEFPT